MFFYFELWGPFCSAKGNRLDNSGKCMSQDLGIYKYTSTALR